MARRDGAEGAGRRDGGDVPEPTPEVATARIRLDYATDGLCGAVLELDGERVACANLASHLDDFARRSRGTYPSLARPAAEVSRLLTELERALGRLSASTEQLVATGGRRADAATGRGPG